MEPDGGSFAENHTAFITGLKTTKVSHILTGPTSCSSSLSLSQSLGSQALVPAVSPPPRPGFLHTHRALKPETLWSHTTQPNSQHAPQSLQMCGTKNRRLTLSRVSLRKAATLCVGKDHRENTASVSPELQGRKQLLARSPGQREYHLSLKHLISHRPMGTEGFPRLLDQCHSRSDGKVPSHL